jgi:hypothetical protein
MNHGDGTFGPFATYPIPSCGAGDIDAFDLDHDGDLDVCYQEYLGCPGQESADRIFISLNRGDGTFEPPYFVEVDLGPYALAGADLNGDGHIDLASAHYGFYGSMNRVDVLLGMGNGSFHGAVSYEVPYGPRDILAADLDQDGALDLATCNTGSGVGGIETTSVMRGRGDGSFEEPVVYFGAFSPDLLGATGIDVGDADHDDDLDLIVSNTGSNDICFYANLGDGTFATPVRYGIGKGATSVIYGDFTNDGTSDLAAITGVLPGGVDKAVAIVPGRRLDPALAEEPDVKLGTAFLSAAVPNPFTKSVRIAFHLPPSGDSFQLQVVDAGGRIVRELARGQHQAGRREVYWDGTSESGRPVAAGTYFVRLRSGDQSASSKVIHLE